MKLTSALQAGSVFIRKGHITDCLYMHSVFLNFVHCVKKLVRFFCVKI